jgi:hypothetical protein
MVAAQHRGAAPQEHEREGSDEFGDELVHDLSPSGMSFEVASTAGYVAFRTD